MPFTFDAAAYGLVIADLLAEERLPPLGPGTSNRAARDRLAAATVDRLFAGRRVADPQMADACRSALWLYHDFLDESHTISQSIETPTGSFWHGIMHRREPDYSNAKYWFRRVGRHPVGPDLASASRILAQSTQGLTRAAWLASAADWDAFAFTDLCETVESIPGPDHDLARRVSFLEWQLLFDYCHRQAIA